MDKRTFDKIMIATIIGIIIFGFVTMFASKPNYNQVRPVVYQTDDSSIAQHNNTTDIINPSVIIWQILPLMICIAIGLPWLIKITLGRDNI
jgi:hypothetical protein